MAEVVQLTLAGKKALEDKLEYLKNVRRAEITEEIAVARSFGDLSENAEYDAAKDAQAHNELEIMELEAMLKNVVIIDGGNHAQFGNYGEQKGDPPATISREDQQNIAVKEILDFIQEKSKELYEKRAK